MRTLSFFERGPRVGAFLFSLCLLVLAACEPTQVEPAYFGTLTVTVLDGSTSQPLANVAVSTTPATGSFVTDAKGQVVIASVPAGLVSVAARRATYDATTGSATIANGQSQSVVLLLNKTAATNTPGAATRPTPTVGATGQPADVQLSWRPAAGALKSDSLKYDVVLYESNNLNQRTLLSNARDTTVLAPSLRFSTTYYWQVTVRNPAGVIARSPVWSFQTKALPDNRVLFVRTVNGNADIYSANEAGANLVQLTSSAFVETAPRLSPNLDLVAYASNATGQFQLYTMNRDGSNKRRITTLAAEGYNNAGVGYCWSPDGGQLLYAHYDQLYRVNRDGTGLVQIATAPAGRHFRECDWTAQGGGRIAVQTVGPNVFDSEILLGNTDGSGLVQLVGNLPGRVDSPAFSIDGRTVAYTHDAAGFNDAGGRQLDAHIYLQRLDGSAAVDISGSSTGSNGSGGGKKIGTNDLYPHYAPDGFRLYFVNTANDNRSAPDVWVTDPDGRNRTLLFADGNLPDWR